MRFSRYTPTDEHSTPLDHILDAATRGAYQVPDLQDCEFDPEVLARQSAQAVRVALTELAEMLTLRDPDGRPISWQYISARQLAELAACITDDTSAIDPPDLLDREALTERTYFLSTSVQD